MNFISLKSLFVHSVRFLITAFVCISLFFSSALPAFAMGSTPSNTTKGEVNLNKIQEKTDKTIYDPPMSMEEVQKRSQPEKGGINEVQGAADADKMKNPDNTRDATTVLDDIKDAFKNIEK